MENYTYQQQDLSLGNLVWEYVPSKADISSLRRITFYITLLGVIFIGLLIFLLISPNKNLGWRQLLPVALMLILLAIGSFITAWFVTGLARRKKQHRVLFYEQGIKDVQVNKTR